MPERPRSRVVLNRNSGKMATYIQVVEELTDDEVIELPVEPDGTMLLSTLTAQFPCASGLKYRNPGTGSLRGLRVVDGRIQPPDGIWGDHLYIAVFPKDNKRKGEDNQEKAIAKTRRVDQLHGITHNKTIDLIVLGLAWKTTQAGMREYFEEFGELLICELKLDRDGKSKGFGFVRFKDVEAQNKVVSMRHVIDGRHCDVKFPDSKNYNNKMFIGRMTSDMTKEDVYEYFSQFGEVTDVYIPKNFRGFGFITFLRPEVAARVASEDHILKGTSLFLSDAEPKNSRKSAMNSPDNNQMYGGQNFGGGFGGQGQYHSRNDYNQVSRRGGRSGGSMSGGGGGNYRDYRDRDQGGGGPVPNSPGMGGGGMGGGGMGGGGMGGGMVGGMAGGMGSGGMGGGMGGAMSGVMGGNPGGGPAQMGNFPWNQAMLAALSQAGWGMMSNMLAQGMQQGLQQQQNSQQQQQQQPPQVGMSQGGGASAVPNQQPMQQNQTGGGGYGSSQPSLGWGGGQNTSTDSSSSAYLMGDGKSGAW